QRHRAEPPPATAHPIAGPRPRRAFPALPGPVPTPVDLGAIDRSIAPRSTASGWWPVAVTAMLRLGLCRGWGLHRGRRLGGAWASAAVVQRDPGADPEAAVRQRAGVQFPAEHGGPLAHAEDAVAGRVGVAGLPVGGRPVAGPVVGDLHRDLAGAVGQP